MLKTLCLILITISINACTNMKVVPVDAQTGLFPTSTKAEVILSKPIDLDERKQLLVVESDESFVKGSIENMEYFDKVIGTSELETQIIKANLTDKISSVDSKIGLNNAARFYKDFLLFHVKIDRTTGNETARFLLTDPITSEDLFITETKLDYVWKGVNDTYNWYPMFNSMIEYIQENSKTYKK